MAVRGHLGDTPTGASWGHSPRIFEEVFVYPLDDVGLSVLDADVVFDHEVRERAAVDQHQPSGDTFGIVFGVAGESARGDEDAAIGLGAVQGTDELLNLRPPDRSLGCVALRLDIDAI